jgi:hypothetical protein
MFRDSAENAKFLADKEALESKITDERREYELQRKDTQLAGAEGRIGKDEVNSKGSLTYLQSQ